ncbi:MAG: hypothetical protein JO267_12950 [Alphaproteobacteria bacterium]|nr:hypothetical protein [Alphaproteobacteria bacterium]
MKALTISALFAGAITIALSPALTTVYGDAYPQDAGKRQALALCAQSNQGFNRLFATERAACYEHFAPVAMPVQPQFGGQAPHIGIANFVDLWKAQGRGHQPTHDVLTQQQNAESLRQIRSSMN